MQVEPTTEGWQVTPPSWRFDIGIEPDLVEEAIRVIGYDRVPEVPALLPQRFRARPESQVDERSVLDRWALSEAHRLARDVDAALAAYDTQKAGRLLSAYVDDLSNWYVRRSRRRFWAGDPAALATLHECLYVVTLLMAPFTPFITERVWQDLFASTSSELPDSVHLAAWPDVDGSLVDDELADQMALVRRLVELGRAARATSSVRTRQPLGRALVAAAGWDRLPADLRAEVSDELNCGELLALGETAGDLVDVSVKANFRALGKRFGKGTPPVAQAIADADAAALVASLRSTGSAHVEVDGEQVATAAGAATMGHPAEAVALLANWLGARGRAIEAGWVVFSGGLTAAVPVAVGSHVTATFGHLGSVTLRGV